MNYLPLITVAVFLLALLIRQARRRKGQLQRRLAANWGRVRSGDEARENNAGWIAATADDHPPLIDQRTWIDLDLDQVIDTIDHTMTPLGHQALYTRLRSGTADAARDRLESLAQWFARAQPARIDVQTRLGKASHWLGNGLWYLLRHDAIPARWWYAAAPLLALTMVTLLIATPWHPILLLAVGAVAGINLLIRATTASNTIAYLGAFGQVGPVVHAAERLAQSPELIERSSAPHIRDDLRALHLMGRVLGWLGRDPLRYGDIIESLIEYLNLLFLVDANALLFGSHALARHHAALERVSDWIGEIDLALGIASLRAEARAWCIPEWADTATTIRDMWHPMLAEPVTNSIELDCGTGLILTGANMSGKSTYLRTVGVAAVLARAINTCPAAAWSGREWLVGSLIGRADDLSAGKSYYLAEAERVVTLLDRVATNAPTIFLLDELLRGTNTVERLAAGDAILRALLLSGGATPHHAVIVATHDGELVDMLRDCYQPWHFRETVTDGHLDFDFRIRPGPATTRTALALLAASGAPADVIERARVTAELRDRANARTTGDP